MKDLILFELLIRYRWYIRLLINWNTTLLLIWGITGLHIFRIQWAST